MPKAKRTYTEEQKAQKREYLKQWHVANPRKGGEASKRWREKNKGRAREARLARYRAHPERAYERQLRYQYGIELKDRDQMLIAQNFECAGCGASFWDVLPCVDHCHTTGKVRGILCKPCNTSLGAVRDNPATLRRLADYIEKE